MTGPYSAHKFYVELRGITEAAFDECSGLQAEVEVEEWREGGRNDMVHRLPGRVRSHGMITLRRGVATPELWRWFEDVMQGEIRREPLSLVLLDAAGAPAVRWDVAGALPVKWSGPGLRAGSAEVAFESIELIHDGFRRAR